eukprot:SAG31_NODE_83_length_27039_cov_14.035746_26_plen_59_part_00
MATSFSAAPNTKCGTHEPVRPCSTTPMNGTITPKAFVIFFIFKKMYPHYQFRDPFLLL